jgi:ribosomal protein S18 acetylase RimI-like enzyme
VLVLRGYVPEDIPAIVLKKSQLTGFHAAADPHYYAPAPDADDAFKKYLEKRAADADFKIIVAIDNDACVGFVMGWIEERPPIYQKRKVGYLSNIFVDKPHRRRRVGERLYRGIEDWFMSKNVDFIEIRADARNLPAMKSFKRYGLKELSVTFYKPAGLDRHK